MKVKSFIFWCCLVGGFSLAIISALSLILFGCKQSPKDYTYPRRAVQAAQLSNWIEQAGDPLCFIDYDMIVTSSSPYRVDEMLENAREAGGEEWADNVTICYKICLRTVRAWDDRPPNWAYGLARHSPDWAHQVATYENKIRGCDWLIKDQYGNVIPIYTDDHLLTDWSPYCPVGLWDGIVRNGKSTYSIGDTRGLTVYEWLAGPMRDNVVLSEEFLGAYDAFCLDDDPFIGSPGWHVSNSTYYQLAGQGRNVNRQEYDALCRPAVKMWHYEFAGELNHKVIMLAQNYGFSPNQDSVFTTDVHANYNGSTLPSYGFGGYWPEGDILTGWAQWLKIDKVFHPYGIGVHERLDAMQGIPVCFTECLVRHRWSVDKQYRLARESLAHTLMHDALFHSAYANDEAGINYGHGTAELFTFLEMEFELGKALTGCLKYCDLKYPNKPLFYRQFQNGTVVINMHTIMICGIPGRDAVWFDKPWPQSYIGEIF